LQLSFQKIRQFVINDLVKLHPKIKNMINLKKAAIASLFVATSAFAQDGGVKGLLLNDASVGLNVGLFNSLSEGSEMELGYGLNYTKQVNAVVGIQVGVMMGSLTNNTEGTDEFTSLNVRGIMNTSNLSINSCPKANFYLAGGFNIMSIGDDSLSNALTPNVGVGMKYAMSNKLDLDLSANISSPSLTSNPVAAYSQIGLGLSYRFSNTEESVEWNNPLDAMYGDLATVKTEIEGLSTDTDGDGVADAFDGDNNTPEGVAVDGKGNALDVDMDGIADYADEDPFTARGVQVDANGRELDSDKDGVANSIDIEPNTESGATVNFQGKEIRGAKGAFMPAVYFDFNSAKVSYANYERLAAVASLLQANPKYKLSVIGYADAVGNSANNHKIALRRANAVVDALSSMFSIDASRLTASSKGEDAPLANESVKVTETTADGQVISNNLTRMNRRVEFVIE
jgi:outer membrane protein OmpA-like peptidoglycan-associated protein